MLMQTMTHVPPAATTRSWFASSRSMSSVMLNAYIGLTAGAVGVRFSTGMTARDALGERRRRAVALQLVVLDEVDAGRGELADELGELGGRQADARA